MKRTPGRIFVAVYAPALGLLGAITVGAIRTGRAFGYFLRDPSAIARIHPLAGVVSQVGALLWSAAAVSSFLTASVLRRRHELESFRFHVASGILSTILLLDDLFQGHEYFAPHVLHIREHTVYAFYALAIPLYLFVFRRKILSEEGALMGLALLFLALSMAVDIPNFTSYGSGLVEDGFKFLGIASWSAFFIRTAANELSATPVASGDPGRAPG